MGVVGEGICVGLWRDCGGIVFVCGMGVVGEGICWGCGIIVLVVCTRMCLWMEVVGEGTCMGLWRDSGGSAYVFVGWGW